MIQSTEIPIRNNVKSEAGADQMQKRSNLSPPQNESATVRSLAEKSIITQEQFVDFREDPHERITRRDDFTVHMAKSKAFYAKKQREREREEHVWSPEKGQKTGNTCLVLL